MIPNGFYLAGPMSGIPENNYPAFHREAARLRALGLRIANPAEASIGENPTWAGFMREDIGMLITCESVVVLPGWEKSRGATLEVHIARSLGMPILDLDLQPIPCDIL